MNDRINNQYSKKATIPTSCNWYQNGGTSDILIGLQKIDSPFVIIMICDLTKK